MDATPRLTDAAPAADGQRVNARQVSLMVLPIALVATTIAAFQLFVALFGFQLGYFLGFAFKWIFWCLAVPLWLVDSSGVRAMFRRADPPVGTPAWLGWLLLALPLVVAYWYAFPRVLPYATVTVLLVSAMIALVNGTLEEILWRGTFVTVFPRHLVWGYLYPSLGLGLWHLAPQSVSAIGTPAGTAVFVLVAKLFGLFWGWVAWRTGSIRWPVVSHVLLDFAGFGALIYFR